MTHQLFVVNQVMGFGSCCIVSKYSVKKLMLGVGTGRCGTTWLSTFLGQQTGIFSSHETVKFEWAYDGPITIEMFPLNWWLAAPESIVADIGSYTLPHFRKVASCFDTSLIVLQRDRRATIDSWLRWTNPKHNYWVPHTLGIWEDDGYDGVFPKFDLETAEKSEAIGAYYDYYYSECEKLKKEFDYLWLTTESLSDLETKKVILAFTGIPESDWNLEAEGNKNKGPELPA
jgi:hypothetical protein